MTPPPPPHPTRKVSFRHILGLSFPQRTPNSARNRAFMVHRAPAGFLHSGESFPSREPFSQLWFKVPSGSNTQTVNGLLHRSAGFVSHKNWHWRLRAKPHPSRRKEKRYSEIKCSQHIPSGALHWQTQLTLTSKESPLIISAQSFFLLSELSSKCASERLLICKENKNQIWCIMSKVQNSLTLHDKLKLTARLINHKPCYILNTVSHIVPV